MLPNFDIIETYLCLYFQVSNPNSTWIQNIICISTNKLTYITVSSLSF